MSEIPTIGDVVREWRQYRQISLTEFAQKTRLSKGYISELEHNKIDNPKMDKLETLAEALGITVMDILSRRMPRKDGRAGTTPTPAQPAANVGSDVQRVRAIEEGEQTISSLSPLDLLAATGTFGSPSSLVVEQGQQLPTFEEQVRQILTSANLPYAKRMIAQHMSLEAIRIICWGLKEATE